MATSVPSARAVKLALRGIATAGFPALLGNCQLPNPSCLADRICLGLATNMLVLASGALLDAD